MRSSGQQCALYVLQNSDFLKYGNFFYKLVDRSKSMRQKPVAALACVSSKSTNFKPLTEKTISTIPN